MNCLVVITFFVLSCILCNFTLALPQNYATAHLDYNRVGYPGYQPIQPVYPAYPTYPIYPTGGTRGAVGGIVVKQTPYGKTVVAGGIIKKNNQPYYVY